MRKVCFAACFLFLPCLTLEVPVYDSRPGFFRQDRGFDFSDNDFASLTSCPRYKLPESEIPIDAAVAVGYTANTYKTTAQSGEFLNLSTNLIFIIVLGLYEEA